MGAFKAMVASIQLVATLSLTTAALTDSALAEEVISVVWGKAQFLPLKGEPSNIIIGDPNVADISVEGSGKVLIFGKVPGETNLMVLDAGGEILLDAAVVVAPGNARHVSIISPSDSAVIERTWNCNVRCVQVVGPGSIDYKAPKRAAGGTAGATPDLTGAAAQTAGGIADMDRSVASGAKSVAGQSNSLVVP